MLPPLDWLRSFEAAARLSNFTAAGRELGVTQAAVSQHIKLLEAVLGRALFRRQQRGVVLTGDGAAYLPHVQAAFDTLRRSTGALFGPQRNRTVRLCGPVSFLTLWLAPRLEALRGAHPRVRLAVSTMQVPADYDAADADLDIRFGDGDFAGRTAHRLTTERLVPLAAPGLRESLAADWPAGPLLSVAGARETWPDWFALAQRSPPPTPFFQCDSFVIAYEAARAGGGVLLGTRTLAAKALADGSLVQVSTIELASRSGHFLTHAAGRPLHPEERALIAWFLAEAGGSA